MEFEHLNMVNTRHSFELTFNLSMGGQENNHWSSEEISLFASVVNLAPDTFPCDLAVICRKPCFEVNI